MAIIAVIVRSMTVHSDVGCELDQFCCGCGDCIPKYKQCDNKQDCADNTDEQNCSRTYFYVVRSFIFCSYYFLNHR